jgi:hypothetical protein
LRIKAFERKSNGAQAAILGIGTSFLVEDNAGLLIAF